MSEIKEPMMTAMKEDSLKRYLSLFSENLGVKAEGSKEMEAMLTEAYNSKERRYHNMGHVISFLKFVESRKDKIENYVAMIAAVLFHDVVYDTRSKDNEVKSALLCREILSGLGINDEVVKKAEGFILATAKHENPGGEHDIDIFLDGDLSILGSDEKTYDNYARAIREEYSWISDEDYKKGRKEFLQNFIKREYIYFTKEAQDEFEDRAIKNIKKELAGLEVN